MKIDGSSQPIQCEAEAPQTPSAGPRSLATQRVQPMASVDRVEQARVEERAYAGERSPVEEKLFGVLASVPTPGVLELEVGGKLGHNGGKGKVTAERDATGEYLIRVEGKLSGGLPTAASVGVGVSGAMTYRVRTPEAAADLLQSLVATGLSASVAAQSTDLARTAHYGVQHLERVELSVEAGVGVHGHMGIKAAGLELNQKTTGFVDFDKHLLVTENAVKGELAVRGSVLLARSGFEGEVALKLRTETRLPDEVLARVASGELSVSDALAGAETTRRLMFEGEERSDVQTVFAQGYSQVKKLEAEVDLDQLASHPTEPGRAIKGEIKTMMSDLQSVGVGLELPGVSGLARASVYTVHTQHLFHHGDASALQSELDTKRSLHH